ncbi:hypothetical protein PoB_000943900 [Plakobranchus ocellatus]|uniref:Uncharacterized protein n=1 Tax=Plakobranchus ocellatus TaxID=259542 RepID=A0AAV3YIU7_9GAST|nr:hypothetical protein PoB_000943900 [Plakobranchus ocellatus]
MFETTLALLCLFSGLATAQQPSMTIVINSSSFWCSDEYLVVGEDFVTFEMELSGNSPDYTYNVFDGPRFRRQKLVTEDGILRVTADKLLCVPFRTPQNGFCVERNIVNTTGCSCEAIGPQVYRIKLVYRIEDISGGRLELLWPSVTAGDLSVFYYLPEVRGEHNLYVMLCFVTSLVSSSFVIE